MSISAFLKWMSGRQGPVEDFDENKEQLLTGIERGFLVNDMRGDVPPPLPCANDDHCKKYNNNLICRRIKSKDSPGGYRAAGSHSDGDKVIYEVENGYENECVSPKGHTFVAEPIYGRPANRHENGGGRRKRSYTKKKSKRKVSKHKKSKNRSKRARKTRRKKRRKTKKKNTFN